VDKIIVGILQDEFSVNKRENYEKIKRMLIEKYQEADLVVLPEYSMVNVLKTTPEETRRAAEPLEDSWFLSKLSDLSSKLSTSIATHFIEENNGGKPYSSTVIVLPTGRLEKAYSKIHLFDAYGFRESDYFTPGRETSKKILVGNLTLYSAICYDLRFPELFRTYALGGADGVIVQAGWVRGPLKEEILDALGRVRSHENTMYLILSSHTGELYVGRSGLFSPLGYRVIDLGYKPGYAEVLLDRSIVAEARRLLPVLDSAAKHWKISLRT
jgi:predicted amidohydrolase